MFRKVYLRIRLFLYSSRNIFNRIAIILMATTLFYLFINNFFFNFIILNKGMVNQAKQKYPNAIAFYNFAGFYYKINHFSNNNKEIYIKLPYIIANCYLLEKNKIKSFDTMSKALASIQKEYGIYSTETADFIRKYLIPYLLETNNYILAKQEFSSLLTIYKKIGYDENVMADLICLSGDFYFKKEDYESAFISYKDAYNIISKKKKPDYDIYANIVKKLAFIKQSYDADSAIILYQNTIDLFEKEKINKPEIIAEFHINLGDVFIQKPELIRNAISNYETGIEIIKTLPKTSSLKQNLTTYYLTLRDLYEKSGQPHLADKIDLELARKRRFDFLY